MVSLYHSKCRMNQKNIFLFCLQDSRHNRNFAAITRVTGAIQGFYNRKIYVFHWYHYRRTDISDHRYLASYRHQNGVLLGHKALDYLLDYRTELHRGCAVYRQCLLVGLPGCVWCLGTLGHRRALRTETTRRERLVSQEPQKEEVRGER